MTKQMTIVVTGSLRVKKLFILIPVLPRAIEYLFIMKAMPCEMCLRAYADSKGPDQSAHPCSLNRAVTVC